MFSILFSFAVYFHEILLSISLSWAKKDSSIGSLLKSKFHKKQGGSVVRHWVHNPKVLRLSPIVGKDDVEGSNVRFCN